MTTSGAGFAFSLTLAAGLATGIGSALALAARRTNTRVLAAALGFSAGAMIWVSFAEILRKAQEALASALGERAGAWAAAGAFFGGVALEAPRLGVPVAVAVAIHNVPEGIAVAVPVFHATGSRAKAFGWSFLSGLAEPAGALVGFALLRGLEGAEVLGVVFGMVAGIMVFVSLDELLPAARRYGEHHVAVYGLFAGMAFTAAGLLLLP